MHCKLCDSGPSKLLLHTLDKNPTTVTFECGSTFDRMGMLVGDPAPQCLADALLAFQAMIQDCTEILVILTKNGKDKIECPACHGKGQIELEVVETPKIINPSEKENQ